MTEDPRGRGYPALAKPPTHAPKAWRSLWQQMLVTGPTQSKRALASVNATRALLRKKRR